MSIRWKIKAGGRDGQAPGLGGRLVASLFFAIFLAFGVFFLVAIGHEAWRGLETFGWEERRCEILSSEVVRAGGDEPYAPRVRFRAQDGGRGVSGTTLQRGEPSYRSYAEAEARLAPYPVGASAACYVAPGGEAVLERGPVWIGAWLLLPLVFVAIGGFGLVASWRRARTDSLGRPVLEPLGQRARRGRPGRGLVGFGLVLLAIGGVFFWFAGARPLLRMQASQGWDRHVCVVEHSAVVAHSGDDSTTYSVDILYRWERGRGVERSNRYSFFGGSSSGRDGKTEIVRAHPVGAEVECWVDPEHSGEAVLERGFTAHALVALVPLVFLAVGAGLVIAGRRKQARLARMRDQALSGQVPFAAEDPVFEVLPAFELQPGPVELGTQSSRLGRALGLTAMALFWNGIVAVFAYQAWSSFERGRPDWFLVVFLVPFVLVGVGFVVGIFYTLLGAGNPRPALVANTRAPRLGERLEIQWRFGGGADRIERLRIAIQGREQATYQVGTNSRTVSETFFEHALVEAPAPTGAMGGQASFTLPADTMHSFQSAHNQVIWELTLVGEIPRWPDVKETYPLVVLPHPTRGEAA